ncbi:MAG: universal stress protein [Bacteroidetes bacterium]|nr:universal stress protein [Bacteroidota bacterium]
MKTILVPTDFSECSEAAFSYAALIAKKTGAQILLLHVLDVPHVRPSVAGAIDAATTADVPYMMGMMKVTKAKMKKIMSDPVFKNCNVKDNIEIGFIAQKVNEAVKKHKADMIVMGTHGTQGLDEFFLGSNAERVVRNAEVPVLSVKEKIKNLKLETIMYASDFSEEALAVFPIVKQLAETLKTKINLMKVITRTDFETTRETKKHIHRFQRLANAFDYPVFIYYDDVKQEGIRRYANVIGADIIAIGTHGRHGLSHFFKGSIAEDTVNHSSLPVLTINFRKKINGAKKAVEKNGRQNREKENSLSYQIPSI